ncbi:MAG: ZIP family metal transporter [Candidatus Odinarchaeia archaeon]
MLMLIIGSTLIVSLISLVGLLTIPFPKEAVDKATVILVGFSAGALLGGAFIHLIPETMEGLDATTAATPLLAGFILFFILEKFLWRHCHKGECEYHPFVFLNLIGDGVHNYIDGIVIAASYLVNPALGVTTTIAVALHEIPQEIGDYGVLIHGGLTRKKALTYNFLSAIIAIIGGITGYFLINQIAFLQILLLPFTAGGFIYIAASDLIPELHKELDQKRSWISFLTFIIGLILMGVLKAALHV